MLDYMSLLLIVITIATRMHSANGSDVNQTTFSVYLTVNPPYVWRRHDGKEDGIIPQLFRFIESECENFRLNVKLVPWSSEELNQIIHSNDPTKTLHDKLKTNGDGNGNCTTTNNNENIIIGASSNQLPATQRKKMTSFAVAHSRGLAGIVHRETIGLGMKLYHAMCDSMLILYNGFLLTVIFGVLIWWLECSSSSEMFTSSICPGLLNGIWYAMVTMTTVGFGDIVPKTRLGKLLSIVYMVLCTLLIAALTSVYTERMSNANIQFKGEKISVVNGTWDTDVARRYESKKKHENQIIHVPTYKEAIDKLRHGEVFATLIDYNVAAWYQDKILNDDLRFTKHINQQFDQYIHVITPTNQIDDVFHRLKRCIADAQKITEHQTENYVQPITFIGLDMPDMYYAITTLGITPILSGVCALTLVAVIVYMCGRFIVLSRKRRKESKLIISDVLAAKDRELTLRFLEKKLEEKLNYIKQDILNDYKELLEDNTYISNSVSPTERSELFILN